MELPGRLFVCAACRVQVMICSHCDRGQIYCPGPCALRARRESLRAAGRRYQSTRRGRHAHAERTRHYRARRNKVTHQGSPVPTRDVPLAVTSPMKREDLDEFVTLYNPANRHVRKATWSEQADAVAGTGPEGRWRVYEYDELIARDKASLDIFWLRDESLADSDNLPAPEIIAQEIVDDLEAALEQFRLIAADLNAADTEKI